MSERPDPDKRPFWFTGAISTGVYWFLGVALPFLPFLISWTVAERSGPTVDIKIPEPNVSHYTSVFLGSEVSWILFPFCLYSLVCFALILARWPLGRFFALRFGVYTGVILGTQYSIALVWAISADSRFGGHLAIAISVIVALAILGALFVLHQWFRSKWRATYRIVVASIIGLGFVGLLVGVGSQYFSGFGSGEAFGAALIGALVTGLFVSPPAVVICYGAMSWQLLRSSRSVRPAIAAIPWAFWTGGYAAALVYSIRRTVEVYDTLPTTACYVATAAASGHPRIVGSQLVGNFPVNDQLRLFKLFEIVARELHPDFHVRLRRIYDWLGPRLASVIRRQQLLADVAYFGLKPFEWGARVFLAMRTPGVLPLAAQIYRESKDR